MVRSDEVRRVLKKQPFEPLQFCLTDGRAIIVKHPDQATVSERVLFVGLTKVKRTGPLSTPASGEEIAKDWIIVDLLHIATIEPANGAGHGRSKRKRR